MIKTGLCSILNPSEVLRRILSRHGQRIIETIRILSWDGPYISHLYQDVLPRTCHKGVVIITLLSHACYIVSLMAILLHECITKRINTPQ